MWICKSTSFYVNQYTPPTKIQYTICKIYTHNIHTAICVSSDHWQLALSPSNCSALHITSGSTRNLCPNFVYRVGQSILPCVSCQSDLGVSYNNKLKFWPRINNIVTKSSLRAKLILKSFQTRDHLLLTKAFCVFVRPLLEHCCVIWNPIARHNQNWSCTASFH